MITFRRPPRAEARAGLPPTANAILVEVHAYWQRASGGAALPRWEDLRPLDDLKRLADHLLIVEIAPRRIGPRLLFRHAGKRIVAHRRGLAPPDPTGHFAETIEYGSGAKLSVGLLEKAVAERGAVFGGWTFPGVGGRREMFELLALPCGDAERISHLLGVALYSGPRAY